MHDWAWFNLVNGCEIITVASYFLLLSCIQGIFEVKFLSAKVVPDTGTLHMLSKHGTVDNWAESIPGNSIPGNKKFRGSSRGFSGAVPRQAASNTKSHLVQCEKVCWSRNLPQWWFHTHSLSWIMLSHAWELHNLRGIIGQRTYWTI